MPPGVQIAQIDRPNVYIKLPGSIDILPSAMEEISKSLGRLESRLLSLNSRYVTRTNLLGNVVRSVATAWQLVSLQRNTRDIVVVEAFLHLSFHLLTQHTSHIFLVAISARW